MYKCSAVSMILFSTLAAVMAASDVHANENMSVVQIETRILPFDPQPGIKSLQTLSVDWPSKSINSEFQTGVTTFFGITLASVRDNFTVSEAVFSGDNVRVRATGETASGVRFLPSIDYDLVIEISRGAAEGRVTGCHDGYPAYFVRVDGSEVYRFEHRPVRLHALFGTCGVIIGSSK